MIEHVMATCLVAIVALGAWTSLGNEVAARVRCTAHAISGGGPCAGLRETTPDIVTIDRPDPAPTEAPRTPVDDLFSFGRGFVGGFVDGGAGMVGGTLDLGAGTVGGAVYAVTHPGEVAHALVDTSTHLDSAIPRAADAGRGIAGALWREAEGAADTAMHGTWEERGRLFGGVSFEIVSSAVPVSKIGAVAKLGHAAARADAVAAPAAAVLALERTSKLRPFRLGSTAAHREELARDAAWVAAFPPTEPVDVALGLNITKSNRLGSMASGTRTRDLDQFAGERGAETFFSWMPELPAEALEGSTRQAGITLLIERASHIHFDLTDVRVAKALQTGREGAHRANYTAFELAYLRAHWDRLGSKVTFWHEGKTVKPPW